MKCLNCSREIYHGRYRDSGNWEPDYDPGDDPVAWRHENGYAKCMSGWATPRPDIVVLCGSTRFWKTFQEQSLRLTLENNIVLSVGAVTSSDAEHIAQGVITVEDKVRLDELHKRKIDLADEVFVLNVGGYIGESTRSEIEYAEKLGKPIAYLEQQELDGQTARRRDASA
jgi:hypothetical protein